MAEQEQTTAPAPAATEESKDAKDPKGTRYFRHNNRGAMRFVSKLDPDDSTKNKYHRFTPVRVKFEDGSGSAVRGFIKVGGETLLDNKTKLADTLEAMPYVDEIKAKLYNEAVSGELGK